MRWIYVSPHFDDAVLSCGGLIYEQARQGLPVEIWTVCAGDPPPGPLSPLAQAIHQVWGTGSAAETVALRQEEDRAAASIVGAEICHFSIADCIYRRSQEGNLLYTEDVFAARHPLEAGLDAEIAAALKKNLRPDDLLLCPLTIGGHLDHVLTRDAVESLGSPLHYYADIPYLLDHPEALEPATKDLHADLFPVTEAGLSAWLDGIAAYKSQMKILFEAEEKMREAVRIFWADKRGTRLWRGSSSKTA
ncbi:MAG: PIG-L family deacetylase [Chloroflexi bacterium]|nr:PIG-L family deacetylase [Chloroflexota bacterium]